MKYQLLVISIFLLLVSCGSSKTDNQKPDFEYTIAFGSCNREDEAQPLWKPILANDPDIFLWGGDNVYADTDDPEVLKRAYQQQKSNAQYQKLVNRVPVYGTWDDHDYGQNDGGKTWHLKEASQQLFLDFMNVPENSPRRSREGVYHSELLETEKGSINLIILDTRYFRDTLQKSNEPGKRYKPSEGSILGEQQWNWLEEELRNSDADFNLILSSIQVLSDEHGFETWGNFPTEVEKLKKLILDSGAERVILLSGDRHISEFSAIQIDGLGYRLVDFTSSGLTHSYEQFSGEPNSKRIGEVVKEKSFGLLHFDFSNKVVKMEMRGENNKLQQEYQLEFMP